MLINLILIVLLVSGCANLGNILVGATNGALAASPPAQPRQTYQTQQYDYLEKYNQERYQQQQLEYQRQQAEATQRQAEVLERQERYRKYGY